MTTTRERERRTPVNPLPIITRISQVNRTWTGASGDRASCQSLSPSPTQIFPWQGLVRRTRDAKTSVNIRIIPSYRCSGLNVGSKPNMLSRPCRCTIVPLFSHDSFSYSVSFVSTNLPTFTSTFVYTDDKLEFSRAFKHHFHQRWNVTILKFNITLEPISFYTVSSRREFCWNSVSCFIRSLKWKFPWNFPFAVMLFQLILHHLIMPFYLDGFLLCEFRQNLRVSFIR